MFHGNIPMQQSYLSSLQVLDLSNYNLIGNLSPLPFKNFSAVIIAKYPGPMFLSPNLYHVENLWLITKGMAVDYTCWNKLVVLLGSILKIKLSRRKKLLVLIKTCGTLSLRVNRVPLREYLGAEG